MASMRFFEGGTAKLAASALTKAAPAYVQFYITARCNLACEQCNIIYSNADQEEASLEDCCRIAENLAALPEAVLVNTHPLELMDEALGEGTDPLSTFSDRVVLEITERAPLEGLGDLRERGRRLRARGFRLAIDDLGAGYAALSSFASLEPDMVKIDMSLVRGLDQHFTKRKLVTSVVELCRDLRILVVAEGVETAAERDVLLQVGCDLLQGYLFGRPEARSVDPRI